MTKTEILIELKKRWALYKEGEKQGKSRSDLTLIENEIDRLQDELNGGSDKYDFNKRWATRTVSQNSTEKKEVYTVDRAESELTESEITELEKYAKKTLAQRNYLADFIIKEDPELGKNAAGVGQIINLTLQLYNGKHNVRDL